MFGPEPDGATPVDPDEAEDLIPSHIRTRRELNAWEQANILKAAAWVERTRAPDDEGEARTAYIGAVRAADGHDFEPLLRLLLTGRPQ